MDLLKQIEFLQKELNCANNAALSLSEELQEVKKENQALRFELQFAKDQLHKREVELECLRNENKELPTGFEVSC